MNKVVESVLSGVKCDCGAMSKVLSVGRDSLFLFNEKTGNIKPLWKVKVRCKCGKRTTAKATWTSEEGDAIRAAILERDEQGKQAKAEAAEDKKRKEGLKRVREQDKQALRHVRD